MIQGAWELRLSATIVRLMVQNKTAAAANLRECGTGYLMSLFGAAAALLA